MVRWGDLTARRDEPAAPRGEEMGFRGESAAPPGRSVAPASGHPAPWSRPGVESGLHFHLGLEKEKSGPAGRRRSQGLSEPASTLLVNTSLRRLALSDFLHPDFRRLQGTLAVIVNLLCSLSLSAPLHLFRVGEVLPSRYRRLGLQLSWGEPVRPWRLLSMVPLGGYTDESSKLEACVNAVVCAVRRRRECLARSARGEGP